MTKDEDKSSTVARERFGSRIEGVLYSVGNNVGVDAVWRFPYLVFQNGGGAFVFAYIVLILVIAIPLYTMELAIGQFSSRGPTGIWNCVPAAKGIGYAQLLMVLVVAVDYNVPLAYSLYFLAQSFRSELPWSGCYDWWGADKELCFVRQKDRTVCKNIPSLLYNKYANTNLTGETVTLIYEAKAIYFKAPRAEHVALLANCSNATTSAAEMFWERHVLELSSGVTDVGGLKWDLVACLFVSWGIVFLCVIRGVSSSGKVVYFTATFPFVVIAILLVKGLTLDGAMQGLEYYFIPKFEQLKSLTLWRRAAEQVCYSLSIGFGPLTMMGGYNNFRTPVLRDSLTVIIAAFLAPFLSGIAIFSVLGYMSTTYGIPLEEVAKQGQGLAFVVFPEALTTFWCPQLWSVIFFVMLYLLGIDTLFPVVQMTLAVLSDDFPKSRRYATLSAFVICIGLFLLGLTCVTRGGPYVFNILDVYASGVLLLMTLLLEIVSIMWIYGVNNFSRDMEFMLGAKPNILPRISWFLISPLVLVVLISCYFYEWTPIVYNNEKAYPAWADYVGLVLIIVPFMQIPLFALHAIFRRRSFIKAFQPDEKWGPADQRTLDEYKQFKEDRKKLQLPE